ncbi:hypothetical protein BIY37_03285 [Candidatus Brocadia sapporoensis]|uniref:Uncharacterized protein n=1 Tax=Candidatus Brocadia sapporoensis TaxID=392547 RepID=A0A1V6M228_9BACT|nr:hypothetical protein [Candidatus Brocadia sapporoensis]MDG6004527.1 hypothetical protein [Candidatus Brocadia sp.]OQD46430.1 hypothetical protein BIY37_03285 [Candidatus Brocadia sapporoensis]
MTRNVKDLGGKSKLVAGILRLVKDVPEAGLLLSLVNVHAEHGNESKYLKKQRNRLKPSSSVKKT